jgi:hypothetical protein
MHTPTTTTTSTTATTTTGAIPTTTPSTTTTSTTQPCTTARCVLDAARHGSDCAGDTIPAGITKKLDKAVSLIEQAPSAKKARRLLKRAKGMLGQAITSTRRAAKGKHPKLSSPCANAIEQAAGDVRGGLGS